MSQSHSCPRCTVRGIIGSANQAFHPDRVPRWSSVGRVSVSSIQSSFQNSEKDRSSLLEIRAGRVYHPLAVARRLTLQSFLMTLLLVLSTTGCAALRATGGWAGASVTRGLLEVDHRSNQLRLLVSGTPLSMQAAPALEAQLDRLPGAFLAVRGPRSADQIVVRDFEILEAPDGLSPLIGTIIVDQSGVMLKDQVSRTRLALRGEALVDLRREHASKVWVTGSIVGPQTLLIAHWGLLVPAQ